MDIKRLIDSYRPPQAATELIQQTPILLLVGISGAGKDTVKRQLLQLPNYGEIVSHTTRNKRQNEGVPEQDGVDYHFVSEEAVYNMLMDGQFIEAKLVHGGTVYGTSIEAVRQAGEAGVALTDLDVQGVEEYKAVSDKVVAVFVIPPNFDEWVRRLRRRYSSDEEFGREWERRRQSAIQELERALAEPYYRYIVNDDLNQSIASIRQIMSRPDEHTRQDDEAKLVARDLLQQLKM